jgi:DNA-3-methyladenine glycosylase II
LRIVRNAIAHQLRTIGKTRRFAKLPGKLTLASLAAEERTSDHAHMKRTSSTRTIDSDADVRAGVRALRRKCVDLRRVHDRTGDPPLRRHTQGFEGLARIIVGQQLSIASAEAIWRRLSLAVHPMHPYAFLGSSDEQLRAAGLSRGKVRTLRAVSAAVEDGLDLDGLAQAPDTTVHETLTALPGIGPWSADIYLLFCLGRADAFAPGDLALQTAAANALGLPERPSREALFAIAERWRPWRGVAAHLLWAYYKVAPMGE